MIYINQIKTKEDIINILEALKPYDREISRMRENSFEYQNACDKVMNYFIKIEEALIGQEELNTQNIANADIRVMSYWEYLRNEIDKEELFLTIKEYSNGTLIDIN